MIIYTLLTHTCMDEELFFGEVSILVYLADIPNATSQFRKAMCVCVSNQVSKHTLTNLLDWTCSAQDVIGHCRRTQVSSLQIFRSS